MGKLIDVTSARETADVILGDPILKMAVNAVLNNTQGFDLVRCKNCKNRGTDLCPMYSEEIIEWDDGDGYHDTDFIIHDRTKDEGFCDRGERE